MAKLNITSVQFVLLKFSLTEFCLLAFGFQTLASLIVVTLAVQCIGIGVEHLYNPHIPPVNFISPLIVLLAMVNRTFIHKYCWNNFFVCVCVFWDCGFISIIICILLCIMCIFHFIQFSIYISQMINDIITAWFELLANRVSISL